MLGLCNMVYSVINSCVLCNVHVIIISLKVCIFIGFPGISAGRGAWLLSCWSGCVGWYSDIWTH